MAYYAELGNLSSNQSTILTLAQVTNEASGTLLISGLIIAVLLVQMIAFTRFGTSTLGAITMSSWLCFLYSVVFLLAGDSAGTLINFWFALGLGAVAAFGTWLLYLQK